MTGRFEKTTVRLKLVAHFTIWYKCPPHSGYHRWIVAKKFKIGFKLPGNGVYH